MTKLLPTPESDKITAARSQIILLANFMRWLDSQGFLDATHQHTGLIYEFLGIDAEKLEQERQAALGTLREANEQLTE